MKDDPLMTGFPKTVAAASALFVLAIAMTAGALHSTPPDNDGNMAVQEFLTSGRTGVRTWEVFVGRHGAVCGCTTAPGDSPRDFIMRYSPAKVSLSDGSPEFLEAWSKFCAVAMTPAQGKRRLLASTGDEHGHE